VNVGALKAAEGTSSYGDAEARRRAEVYERAALFPAADEEYEQITRETTLLVDFRRRRVFYKTHEMPTHASARGRHLQNRAFTSLGILALRRAEQLLRFRDMPGILG
jgi:hypothetical protein